MGDFTKLECEVVLKDEDVINFKQMFDDDKKEHENQKKPIPYEHEFFNEWRKTFFVKSFNNFDGNKLLIDIEIKNYECEIEKFYDFLQTIGVIFLTFRTQFCEDECWDDDICYDIWRNVLTGEAE